MTWPRRRRLLTIAHSYCVDVNRRLAQELAKNGDWDVTAVGPARFRGDFAWHTLDPRHDEACAVVSVPLHCSRHVHVMLYGRRLLELLRQPWDLVHCWEEPYIAAAAQVAFGVPDDVPLVFATFQNLAKRYPPPFSWFERYTLARAGGMIAFGRTSFEDLAGRAPGRVPKRFIPPGVDMARFKPDPDARAAIFRECGWDEGTPVVGFLGRLVPEKGVAVLTAALERLKRPWRALVVGSGPLESDLRAWGRRYGDRVRVVTAVQHDGVAPYLNAMNVLCAPSQTTPRWREQFGRMLIEAFASGVPVVASASGEIPHVVADVGLIVGESDADGWERALAALIGDPARRAELAARGRQRAEAAFAWPVVARQHLQFFDEIVAAPAARRAS